MCVRLHGEELKKEMGWCRVAGCSGCEMKSDSASVARHGNGRGEVEGQLGAVPEVFQALNKVSKVYLVLQGVL